jgi:hypothetical protein
MKTKLVAMSLVAFAAGAAWANLYGCSSTSSPIARADGDAGACAPAAPTLIPSYAELAKVLQAGGRARAILDYSKCQLDGKPGPNAVGGLGLDTFELFGEGVTGNTKAYIGASETKLIKFGNGFVNDYVRVNVIADDTVEVLVQYLNPTTFAVTVNETLLCSLNDGTNGAGVTLYKLP